MSNPIKTTVANLKKTNANRKYNNRTAKIKKLERERIEMSVVAYFAA